MPSCLARGECCGGAPRRRASSSASAVPRSRPRSRSAGPRSARCASLSRTRASSSSGRRRDPANDAACSSSAASAGRPVRRYQVGGEPVGRHVDRVHRLPPGSLAGEALPGASGPPSASRTSSSAVSSEVRREGSTSAPCSDLRITYSIQRKCQSQPSEPRSRPEPGRLRPRPAEAVPGPDRVSAGEDRGHSCAFVPHAHSSPGFDSPVAASCLSRGACSTFGRDECALVPHAHSSPGFDSPVAASCLSRGARSTFGRDEERSSLTLTPRRG